MALQTITTDFQRIFRMGKKLYIGISGLATDTLTVFVHMCPCLTVDSMRRIRSQTLTYRHNLYKLRENREMKPLTFLNATCALLFEKRCDACHACQTID